VGKAVTPLAGYLFFDIPSTVALGIVEMQMQFATGDVTPCQASQLAKGIITLSTRYATVSNVFCGNKFTQANLFGLKKGVSIN
jgi:hypothetical protein